MSNKSGTSSQVISLPQGGGALHGIGEKFSPDLHVGTGNFAVPIDLSPGRNGFQLQLNLVYSTVETGFFGSGLCVPGNSRKSSRGTPRYDNADHGQKVCLTLLILSSGVLTTVGGHKARMVWQACTAHLGLLVITRRSLLIPITLQVFSLGN